jgi:transcriptional regulator with XRE-family HTH domain
MSCYLAGGYDKRRVDDGRDITRGGKSRQQLFSHGVKEKKDSPFGLRLREAFQGATNAEIARKMGVNQSAITNYMAGRIPQPDALLMVWRLTQRSIHWLLTGEGEGDIDPYRFLNETHRIIIQKLADDSKRSFEEMLTGLVTDALVARGAQLFANYRGIHAQELEELQMLFGLLYAVEEDDRSKALPSSKRRA